MRNSVKSTEETSHLVSRAQIVSRAKDEAGEMNKGKFMENLDNHIKVFGLYPVEKRKWIP